MLPVSCVACPGVCIWHAVRPDGLLDMGHPGYLPGICDLNNPCCHRSHHWIWWVILFAICMTHWSHHRGGGGSGLLAADICSTDMHQTSSHLLFKLSTRALVRSIGAMTPLPANLCRPTFEALQCAMAQPYHAPCACCRSGVWRQGCDRVEPIYRQLPLP
jgi:hypothetical protein